MKKSPYGAQETKGLGKGGGELCIILITCINDCYCTTILQSSHPACAFVEFYLYSRMGLFICVRF